MKTKRWEYYSFLNQVSRFGSNAMTIADLNRLGSEGWELVSITIDNDGGWRYTFKRPI